MDICSAPITAWTAAKIVSAIFMVPLILIFMSVCVYWFVQLATKKDSDILEWMYTVAGTGVVTTIYTFFLFS